MCSYIQQNIITNLFITHWPLLCPNVWNDIHFKQTLQCVPHAVCNNEHIWLEDYYGWLTGTEWLYSSYYPGINLKGLAETTNNTSQDSWCSSHDSTGLASISILFHHCDTHLCYCQWFKWNDSLYWLLSLNCIQHFSLHYSSHHWNECLKWSSVCMHPWTSDYRSTCDMAQDWKSNTMNSSTGALIFLYRYLEYCIKELQDSKFWRSWDQWER
jgi:hypothetical protein